jgi:REP element-mobilizing transposase RayT
MPRKARIDAPGALHHVICRGIERRKIFDNDDDRDNFVERLETILQETSTPCYAWALIPNHFHLLLRSGKQAISTVMRRLLTGYAVSYNRRHRRSGHLFQNRFKSILCQEDLYLKELVAYIHLNPLRAGIVADLKELAKYPYGGHSVLVGEQKIDFQDTDYVLRLFGDKDKAAGARRGYLKYVRKRVELGRRPELVGGGLLRSSGGWGVLKAMSKARIHLKGDERILGESDFVKDVLAGQKERYERRYWLHAQGYDIDRVVEKAAEVFGMDPAQVRKPGNQPQRVKARSLVCYWAVRELGMSGTSVSKLLGIGQPAVSRSVVRGEKLAQDMSLSLTN